MMQAPPFCTVLASGPTAEASDAVGRPQPRPEPHCGLRCHMQRQYKEPLSQTQRLFVALYDNLAEREGFEPSNELPRYILSRDAPSTRLGHLSKATRRTQQIESQL